MYLVWLRVAVVLYAGAGIAAFPTVLHQNPRWRSACVHVGGLAFLFHFVSVVEMLALTHSWVPVSLREGESLLGLGGGRAVLPGVVDLRNNFPFDLCVAHHILHRVRAIAGL